MFRLYVVYQAEFWLKFESSAQLDCGTSSRAGASARIGLALSKIATLVSVLRSRAGSCCNFRVLPL